MSDLVSIIIPVYNRSALLRRAVASAIAQTYRPIEVIIVDDGSTDDTPRAITELATSHAEIRPTAQRNGGPGLARETGRQAARGNFIQYLDSDDLLLPTKLEKMVAALENDSGAGVAYCRARYRDPAGTEIQCTWKTPMDGQTAIFPHFLLGRLWETVTPLYRRSVTDAAGPWTGLRLEEDWEYDSRIGALNPKLTFVREVLAEHHADATERLSRGDALDPERLADRAEAHVRIYGHALAAGSDAESREMQHYARELFHLARQTGAAGLEVDSQRLFLLAREASGSRGNRLEFRLYAAVARFTGWTAAGRIAGLRDRVLRKKRKTDGFR